jgi:hypothetical protein
MFAENIEELDRLEFGMNYCWILVALYLKNIKLDI